MLSVRQGVSAAVCGGRACLATRAAALEDSRLQAPAVNKQEFRRHLEALIRSPAAEAGRPAAAEARRPRLPDTNEWAPAGHRHVFSSRGHSSSASSSGHGVRRLPDTNEWAPSQPDVV